MHPHHTNNLWHNPAFGTHLLTVHPCTSGSYITHIIILSVCFQINAEGTMASKKRHRFKTTLSGAAGEMFMMSLLYRDRQRGQCWPTTGHSKTQRGTSLLPFTSGTGVTAAYKERIPTETLHPQSPSTTTLAPHYSARRFPRTSVAFPWQQPLTDFGGDWDKRCNQREFKWEIGVKKNIRGRIAW